VTWNVAQNSPRLDWLLGNLAYPLYLFHWIQRDWYYHFSQRSDPIWTQCALLSINFLAASAGAVIILLVVDQPLDRLRAQWVGARKAGVAESERQNLAGGLGERVCVGRIGVSAKAFSLFIPAAGPIVLESLTVLRDFARRTRWEAAGRGQPFIYDWRKWLPSSWGSRS
jgi:hypothetical protein